MKNFLLDTMIISYLARRDGITNDQFSQLANRCERRKIIPYISLTNYLELVCGYDQTPKSLASIKSEIAIIESLSMRALSQPNIWIRNLLIERRTPLKEKVWILDNLHMIGNEALLPRFEVHVEQARKRRQEFVGTHVGAMMKLQKNAHLMLLSKENKSLDISQVELAAPIPPQKANKERVEEFLLSKQWVDSFLNFILYSVNIQSTTEIQRFRLKSEMLFYQAGFASLFEAILAEGYIPNEKKENDALDLLQLMYISPNNSHVLVTEDNKGIFKRVRIKHPDRIIDYKEFIKQALL